MPSKLEEKDWDTLIKRIYIGKCTPFFGAGACKGTLPLGPEIAKKWTKEYGSKPRPHKSKGGKVIKPRGFNMMLPGKKQYTTVY